MITTYQLVVDGRVVSTLASYIIATLSADKAARENPMALSVTVDRNGHTLYNAKPGEYECKAGCGAALLNPSEINCEACS